MSFIWPWMLLVPLLLGPLLVWLYLRLRLRQRRAAADLGPLGIGHSSSGAVPNSRRHIPPLFFYLGMLVLSFGLARPQMAVSLPRVEGTVILAFDVSNSMLADDLEPTRIEAAKTAARSFVEAQPSTIQIGVVAFGNAGLVVQAPTGDQAAILATIDRLSPQGATSLGQGIFTSLNAITGEPILADGEEPVAELGPADFATIEIGNYSSAVILLLTDGENTGPPDPMEMAQIAATAGVRIYPVGIGSPEGAVIEVEGFNILTQLNEAPLQEIASLTNGSYYFAASEEALQEIYRNIDLQMTTRGEKMEITAIVAAIGLLLFLIGSALSLLWLGRIL